MGRATRKKRLLRRVILLYFFMNAVSIALFTYIITANQASLLSDLARYQAKEVISLLVQNAASLPEVAQQNVSDSALYQARLNAMDTTFNRLISQYIIYDKNGAVRQSAQKVQLDSSFLALGQKAKFLRDFSGMDYFLRVDEKRKQMRFYIALEDYGLPGLYALAVLQIEEITRKFRNMYEQIVFTVIALTLLHILFAYFIFRIIIKPVLRLQMAANQIAQGDYEARVPVSGADEISDLAEHFNRMTGIIKRTVHELEDKVQMISDSHEQMEMIANMDELTQVYNRRYVMTQLERLVAIGSRYGNPLAALMIDVDHFKQVNDTHGHQVGDGVLRQVVQRLRVHNRVSDILARYGGEEFVLIMPETELEAALAVAEKLRDSVATLPFQVEGLELSVTISIGVAELTNMPKQKHMDCTALHILSVADAGLYAAKQNGRNRVENGHKAGL